MREIKFRIRLGGHWFYWGFINGSFVGLPMSTEEQLTMQELQNRSEQYVGFKDKNGVEIYKGDIVEWTDQKGEIMRSEVVWERYMWNVMGFYNASQDTPGDAFSEYCSFCVIGNIHENQDLFTKN